MLINLKEFVEVFYISQLWVDKSAETFLS